MERKILFAVDGTEKGLESVSVVGRLLKDQTDLQLVLFHCVQQLASLLPGSVCPGCEGKMRNILPRSAGGLDCRDG